MEQLIRARVFISHNHSDKQIASEIARNLLRQGHEVWLDSWELLPGDSLIEKISEGMINSSYLLVLLSCRSVASNWVQRELEIAINKQLKDKSIKVIPCLIEDCDIPLFLSPIYYADFRKGFEEGLAELLPAIKMIDIKTFGKTDKEAWSHDFTYDYNFYNSAKGGYSINLTMISQYYNFKGSLLFTIEIKSAEFLTKRFDSMPAYIHPALKVGIFLFYFIGMIEDYMKRENDDLYLIAEGKKLQTHKFNVVDIKGRSVFYISTSLRIIGNNPDNSIKYSYGELISNIFTDSLIELKEVIKPEDGILLTEWIANNPI